MNYIPFSEVNESDDRVHRLIPLLSLYMEDSIYHRNMAITPLVVTTALFSALITIVAISNPVNIVSNEPFIYLCMSVAAVAYTGIIIKQYLEIHRRVGLSFYNLFRVQELLGYLEKDAYLDGESLIALPLKYLKLYPRVRGKSPDVIEQTLFCIGKRGYILYIIYVGLLVEIFQMIILVKLQYCILNWIVVLCIVAVVIVVVFSTAFRWYVARKIFNKL